MIFLPQLPQYRHAPYPARVWILIKDCGSGGEPVVHTPQQAMTAESSKRSTTSGVLSSPLKSTCLLLPLRRRQYYRLSTAGLVPTSDCPWGVNRNHRAILVDEASCSTRLNLDSPSPGLKALRSISLSSLFYSFGRIRALPKHWVAGRDLDFFPPDWGMHPAPLAVLVSALPLSYVFPQPRVLFSILLCHGTISRRFGNLSLLSSLQKWATIYTYVCNY